MVLGTKKASIKILGDSLHYRYELTDHIPGEFFHCAMLCEIGAPYLPLFEALIKRHSLQIETREGKYGFGDYLKRERITL